MDNQSFDGQPRNCNLVVHETTINFSLYISWFQNRMLRILQFCQNNWCLVSYEPLFVCVYTVYNQFTQSDREKQMFSLKGAAQTDKRQKIYRFMLRHMSDEQRFQLTAKLSQEVSCTIYFFLYNWQCLFHCVAEYKFHLFSLCRAISDLI